METVDTDLWTTVARVTSCSHDLVMLALVITVFVVALRIKRSVGAYVFGAAMLGMLVMSLVFLAVDLAEVPYDGGRWLYAFGSLVDVVLALAALAGMALIRPRGASEEAAP